MNERFHTTRWSVIQAAADRGADDYEAAMAELCQTYWPAVYGFLRRRGQDPESARDLTQGFFTRLLDKQVLQAATPDRGRFRSFLLSSVQNFARNEWQRAQRDKRGGQVTTVSIDFSQAESMLGDGSIDRLTPEAVFDRRWALSLLDRAVERLGERMAASGKQALFEAIRPLLTGSPDGEARSYRQLAESVGVSENAFKVAVHRQRQRLGELLREEVAETLTDAAALDDELRHLMMVLSR